MGYDVSIPSTESRGPRPRDRRRHTFVNDRRRRMDLRRIHSNGSVAKRTMEKSNDWLYVLDGGAAEHLIGQCLAREAVGDPPRRRQARSGGRVWLIAAALKAAGSFTRARGFESLPLR
jgi:hypothetical protein